MVKNLVLYDKIYNVSKETDKKDISIRYIKYLNELAQSFPDTKIRLKKLRQFDNRFEVLVSGPEEIFISNMLRKKVGTIIDFEKVDLSKSLIILDETKYRIRK